MFSNQEQSIIFGNWILKMIYFNEEKKKTPKTNKQDKILVEIKTY